MIVGEAHKGCRHWGYKPAASRDARARGQPSPKEIGARVAAYRSTAYGLTKRRAIAQARALEARFPGIEWEVFNHDYL